MDKQTKPKPLYRDYVVMIRFQHLDQLKGDNRGIDDIRSDNEQCVSFQKGQLYVEKTYANAFRIKDDQEVEQRKIRAVKRTIEMFKHFFPSGVLAPQLFIENQPVSNDLQQLLCTQP